MNPAEQCPSAGSGIRQLSARVDFASATLSDHCFNGEYQPPVKASPDTPTENGKPSTSSNSSSTTVAPPPETELTEDAFLIGDGSSSGLLGLSALAGSALLSFAAGSSASSNEDAPAPGGEAHTTGSVVAHDPTDCAQAQAANPRQHP